MTWTQRPAWLGWARWPGWRKIAPVAALIPLLATLAGVAMVSSPAQAATSFGSLALSPATGLDSSPITLTTVSTGTPKGCPQAATNVAGVITGPGQWAAGVNGVNSTDSGLSHTDDFSFPLANTFGNIAADNQFSILPGKYTITVYCQNDIGTQLYGQFTTPLWFTDATHYQSNDPATSQSPTQTVITASPEDRTDLGTRVTLTASITPATATGTVQFHNNQNGTFGPVGSAVPVSAGKASLSSTSFAFALYEFSEVFTPADPD
jgi:hypothetical protein